jgi:hypothetical protein
MKRHAAAYLVVALALIFGLGVLLTHNTGCSVLVPPEISGQDPKVTAAEIAKWEGVVDFYDRQLPLARAAVAAAKDGKSLAAAQRWLDTTQFMFDWAQGYLKALKPPTTQAAL